MCNEACEEGHLHRTYECPVFAKAFDKDGDGDDNNLEVHDDQMQRKLPKIENMYSACPLYTCISPLRLLLRQKMASTDIKEQVQQLPGGEIESNQKQSKAVESNQKQLKAFKSEH